MVLEYSIITTMDTSGLGFMNKSKDKDRKIGGGNISNEDLQTILKFGAQNLFKQKMDGDSSSNQLNTLNLDDVLARAELHEGAEAQSNSALGSAEFLQQFHVSDVSVNQLTWEDLIPEGLRPKGEKFEDEVFDSFQRKSAIPVNYKGADISTDVKKKRRKSHSAKGDSSDPLNEKETRSLVRALLKFGDLDLRYDEIVSDADLIHKSNNIVYSCHRGLLDICNGSDELQKPKLVSYNGVTSINASGLLQRISDLSFLAERMANQPVSKFRVTWIIKSVNNWSVPWGSKDDSMLLFGIFRHGFGSWETIQNDSDLGFLNKFFLEANEKLPKAVHLARRGEFLMKCLIENESKKVSKKVGAQKDYSRVVDKVSAPYRLGSTKKKDSTGGGKVSKYDHGPSKVPKATINPTDGNLSAYLSMDEAEENNCKDLLRPVKRDLKSLQSSDALKGESKAKVIKQHLANVAAFINTCCSTVQPEKLKLKTERHLWKFASYFWPVPIRSEDYRSISIKSLEGLNQIRS